jgi:hypothetical protein
MPQAHDDDEPSISKRTARLIATNDNDSATAWRAVRERFAFAEVVELPPAMIDFDDPEVLLRLIGHPLPPQDAP